MSEYFVFKYFEGGLSEVLVTLNAYFPSFSTYAVSQDTAIIIIKYFKAASVHIGT